MNFTTRERGWASHLCVASMCQFHRSTLISCDAPDLEIVVSTVGRYVPDGKEKFEQIGCGRYFETMIFHADESDKFFNADVCQQISFEGCGALPDPDMEIQANDMHDAAVAEICERIKAGETFPKGVDADE